MAGLPGLRAAVLLVRCQIEWFHRTATRPSSLIGILTVFVQVGVASGNDAVVVTAC